MRRQPTSMAHLNLAIVSLSVALLGPYAGSISGLARVTSSICWTSRPSEALQCGTRIGGQVMGLGDELGQIKEGYLADLLLVDGDSLKDLDLVVHEKNRHVIMKEGALYKDRSAATIVEHTVAAD